MWEWSNRTVKKKPPEKTDRNAASLLAAYNDLIGSGYSAYQSRIRDIQIAETPVDERITAPNPEALYETVRQKIAEFGLPASTRIIEKEYAPQSWQEMNRSFDRYHNLRSRFFKLMPMPKTAVAQASTTMISPACAKASPRKTTTFISKFLPTSAAVSISTISA